MRKLFTLIVLALVGGSSAGAWKLYVNTDLTDNGTHWWTNVRIYAWKTVKDVKTEMNTWEYSSTGLATSVTMFGKQWYVCDISDYTDAIVQYYETSGNNISNQSTDITSITQDRFICLDIESKKSGDKWTWYENGYTCQNNIDSNWNSQKCNMAVVDENTLTRTFTKTDIDNASIDAIYFRIINQEGYIYTTSDATENRLINYGSSTSSYINDWNTNNYDLTNRSFKVTIPGFNYDKIVIKATLSNSTWTLSADAYISKSISSLGYATFGSTASVDFSKAIPVTENTSFTAKKGKVNTSTGKITYTTATTLYGGEGVLLHGDAGTYLIPVAASASADTEHNDFVAIENEVKLEQTLGVDPVYTHYILTNQTPSGTGPLGFYKVNIAGSWCAANTAYLATTYSAASSRDYFPVVEDETEGISATLMDNAENGKVYNLAGQRIAEPQKGLYIVNGKKVIIK